jgi:Fic family protein
MGELEKFLHREDLIPPLIKCGLAHAHFETIHPFLDGNGRVGRLLITFLLCWRGIIKRPLLYISHYFRRHRDEYYDRLQRIRDNGDWEGWLMFFLEAVRNVSLEATETAQQIQALREEHRTVIAQEISGSPIGLMLLDHLFERPLTTVNEVAAVIGRSYPVANELVATFEKLGLLEEITGRRRNRLYSYEPYRVLFE